MWLVRHGLSLVLMSAGVALSSPAIAAVDPAPSQGKVTSWSRAIPPSDQDMTSWTKAPSVKQTQPVVQPFPADDRTVRKGQVPVASSIDARAAVAALRLPSEPQRPAPVPVPDPLVAPRPVVVPMAQAREVVQPVVAERDRSATSSEVSCVAQAVYYESRGEPIQGQKAVADVVMNRVRSGRWAGSACAVVSQPAQFSRQKRWGRPSDSDPLWRQAVGIAADAVNGVVQVSARIMSFHATGVRPGWRMPVALRIGRHVFY